MSQEYDTLIRNALVFDGQGSPPEQVDVAIEAVIDKGTFEDPNQYPAGSHTIFVNGQITVQDDKVTGYRAGQVLTRAS